MRVLTKVLFLSIIGSLAGCGVLRPLPSAAAPGAPADKPQPPEKPDALPEKEEPSPFRSRGRLVCLAEEMKGLYGADVPPVHEHLLGFRAEEAADDGGRYSTILRTAQSEALFVDRRFSEHLLILSGRVFPATDLLEVSGWRWISDGKVYDVFYWCEVCSIRTIDPGRCACCQGDVVLREEPVRKGQEPEPPAN